MASPLARMTVGLLERIALGLWGFRPSLMREIVRQRGALPTLWWFLRNMPRYERTLKRWGPIRTHLATTLISLVNGCPYCVHGHARALQLHYLQRTDRLFPLDDAAITALLGAPAAEVAAALDGALAQAALEDERPPLRRLVELLAGAAPAGPDDRRLAHLIAMFRVLNTCGIEGRVAPDEVHDPINQDRALAARYDALRAA
ncbi:MAG: hypothetical protein H6706_02965 [Myxococcales bacterium]|nr:hypothetical protein [Myxococcales bacterium]